MTFDWERLSGRAVFITGADKNAGKTTLLNYVLGGLRSRGAAPAFLSAGYDGEEAIVRPAEDVSPELELAIREGLVVGRLPCAVAWALANRFDIRKLDVANTAEKLEIRIGQCQLGAF